MQILYAWYTFLNAINFTLPLSLVFAMIISKFNLIRTNELIAMYASGISKNSLIKPIFFTSVLVTVVYIALNFTNFTYSREYAYNILNHSSLSNSSKDLFLKYNNNYIYIERLDPFKKKAYGIRIFKVKEGDLRLITKAKSADFVKEYWILNNIQITRKPPIGEENAKLTKIFYNHYKTLKGFKPKIIENVYEGKNSFSIKDAYQAIKLFLSQNVNVSKIKASLFAMLVFPFFAPLLNMIMFYYLPVSNRFFNLAFASSVFLFASLIVWAILFMLIKMSVNGVVNPELGIILPIFLLSLFATYLYIKNR
jgi:lipopolysaccharide export system permease protein